MLVALRTAMVLLHDRRVIGNLGQFIAHGHQRPIDGYRVELFRPGLDHRLDLGKPVGIALDDFGSARNTGEIFLLRPVGQKRETAVKNVEAEREIGGVGAARRHCQRRFGQASGVAFGLGDGPDHVLAGIGRQRFLDLEKLAECISEQGRKTCHDKAGENIAPLDSHFASICFTCHAQR